MKPGAPSFAPEKVIDVLRVEGRLSLGLAHFTAGTAGLCVCVCVCVCVCQGEAVSRPGNPSTYIYIYIYIIIYTHIFYLSVYPSI